MKISILTTSVLFISSLTNAFNLQRRLFVKATSTTPFLLNVEKNNTQHRLPFLLNDKNYNHEQNIKNLNEGKIMYLEEPTSPNPQMIRPGSNTYIQNDDNNIYYYGAISTDGCYQLKKMLQEMDKIGRIFALKYGIKEPPPINLHIQSLGGELLPSLYIIDVIDKLETPVYTYVDGFAASAATLISVMGKKRFMTEHSLMLIHQLSGQQGGKFNEIKDEFTNMNTLMKIIKNLYLNKTKLDLISLENTLYKDIWLDAPTCLKYGLVDEIL
tara:strand:- start:28 stop:837 length:810 start_codon:yes stop_codon:yes gene_type:complete